MLRGLGDRGDGDWVIVAAVGLFLVVSTLLGTACAAPESPTPATADKGLLGSPYSQHGIL